MSDRMVENLKTLWKLVNQPPLSPERMEVHGYPLMRVLHRYYVRKFWKSLLFVVLILGAMRGLTVFGYAMATKFIADDVVEVQLQNEDNPPGVTLDPTMPGESRLFQLPEPHERQALVNRLDEKPGRSLHEKLQLLTWVSIALVLMEIARHIIGYWVSERTVLMGQHLQYYLRQHLHEKLHALPMSYHDRHSPGRLMTHLFSDVAVIQNLTTQLLRMVPPHILTMVVGVVVLLWIDPILGTLVLVSLPMYVVCYHWFRSRLRIVMENVREREGRLNAHIANRVGNFQLVKAFGRETGEAVDFLRQGKPIVQDNLAGAVLNTGFVVACGVITGVCTTAVLWLGTLRVRDGEMTLGEMLMFYASAGYMFGPVATMTNLAGALHRLRAVAGRVMRVLDEPITLADPEEPLTLPSKPCEIKFDHVTLRYDENRPPAIDDVSFALPSGKRMCVMGPSGSGKTTLAKLICRLYDPTEGEVRFDGVNIRQFKIADLRKFIGFVAQEPIVFSGTIADNIRYGSENANPQAVITAAQYAQIHDFIAQLPERYQTLTYERGLTLSGGQKQRVNLARTLLYDPKILVLDDCTSALDAETEARLVGSLDRALRDRTTVVVTHRVSLALVCDVVMMLDAGRIVEFGPPDALLEQDGPFTALYNQQVRRIIPKDQEPSLRLKYADS